MADNRDNDIGENLLEEVISPVQLLSLDMEELSTEVQDITRTVGQFARLLQLTTFNLTRYNRAIVQSLMGRPGVGGTAGLPQVGGNQAQFTTAMTGLTTALVANTTATTAQAALIAANTATLRTVSTFTGVSAARAVTQFVSGGGGGGPPPSAPPPPPTVGPSGPPSPPEPVPQPPKSKRTRRPEAEIQAGETPEETQKRKDDAAKRLQRKRSKLVEKFDEEHPPLEPQRLLVREPLTGQEVPDTTAELPIQAPGTVQRGVPTVTPTVPTPPQQAGVPIQAQQERPSPQLEKPTQTPNIQLKSASSEQTDAEMEALQRKYEKEEAAYTTNRLAELDKRFAKEKAELEEKHLPGKPTPEQYQALLIAQAQTSLKSGTSAASSAKKRAAEHEAAMHAIRTRRAAPPEEQVEQPPQPPTMAEPPPLRPLPPSVQAEVEKQFGPITPTTEVPTPQVPLEPVVEVPPTTAPPVEEVAELPSWEPMAPKPLDIQTFRPEVRPTAHVEPVVAPEPTPPPTVVVPPLPAPVVEPTVAVPTPPTPAPEPVFEQKPPTPLPQERFRLPLPVVPRPEPIRIPPEPPSPIHPLVELERRRREQRRQERALEPQVEQPSITPAERGRRKAIRPEREVPIVGGEAPRPPTVVEPPPAAIPIVPPAAIPVVHPVERPAAVIPPVAAPTPVTVPPEAVTRERVQVPLPMVSEPLPLPIVPPTVTVPASAVTATPEPVHHVVPPRPVVATPAPVEPTPPHHVVPPRPVVPLPASTVPAPPPIPPAPTGPAPEVAAIEEEIRKAQADYAAKEEELRERQRKKDEKSGPQTARGVAQSERLAGERKREYDARLAEMQTRLEAARTAAPTPVPTIAPAPTQPPMTEAERAAIRARQAPAPAPTPTVVPTPTQPPMTEAERTAIRTRQLPAPTTPTVTAVPTTPPAVPTPTVPVITPPVTPPVIPTPPVGVVPPTAVSEPPTVVTAESLLPTPEPIPEFVGPPAPEPTYGGPGIVMPTPPPPLPRGPLRGQRAFRRRRPLEAEDFPIPVPGLPVAPTAPTVAPAPTPPEAAVVEPRLPRLPGIPPAVTEAPITVPGLPPGPTAPTVPPTGGPPIIGAQGPGFPIPLPVIVTNWPASMGGVPRPPTPGEPPTAPPGTETPTVPPPATPSMTEAERAAIRASQLPAPVTGAPTVPSAPPEPTPTPRVEKGKVRFYHGGTPFEEQPSPRWVAPDVEYAAGYARKTEGATVQYVDIPEKHPVLEGKKAYDDEGTSSPSPYTAFEVPEEIAQDLKPFVPEAPYTGVPSLRGYPVAGEVPPTPVPTHHVIPKKKGPPTPTPVPGSPPTPVPVPTLAPAPAGAPPTPTPVPIPTPAPVVPPVPGGPSPPAPAPGPGGGGSPRVPGSPHLGRGGRGGRPPGGRPPGGQGAAGGGRFAGLIGALASNTAATHLNTRAVLLQTRMNIMQMRGALVPPTMPGQKPEEAGAFDVPFGKLSTVLNQVQSAFTTASAAMLGFIAIGDASTFSTFMGGVKAVAIEIGGVLAPAIKDVTKSLYEWSVWINGMDPYWQRVTANLAKWVIGIGLVTTAIRIMGLSAITTRLAVLGFNAMMAATPWGVAILGAQALVLAVYALGNAFELWGSEADKSGTLAAAAMNRVADATGRIKPPKVGDIGAGLPGAPQQETLGTHLEKLQTLTGGAAIKAQIEAAAQGLKPEKVSETIQKAITDQQTQLMLERAKLLKDTLDAEKENARRQQEYMKRSEIVIEARGLVQKEFETQLEKYQLRAGAPSATVIKPTAPEFETMQAAIKRILAEAEKKAAGAGLKLTPEDLGIAQPTRISGISGGIGLDLTPLRSLISERDKPAPWKVQVDTTRKTEIDKLISTLQQIAREVGVEGIAPLPPTPGGVPEEEGPQARVRTEAARLIAQLPAEQQKRFPKDKAPTAFAPIVEQLRGETQAEQVKAQQELAALQVPRLTPYEQRKNVMIETAEMEAPKVAKLFQEQLEAYRKRTGDKEAKRIPEEIAGEEVPESVVLYQARGARLRDLAFRYQRAAEEKKIPAVTEGEESVLLGRLGEATEIQSGRELVGGQPTGRLYYTAPPKPVAERGPEFRREVPKILPPGAPEVKAAEARLAGLDENNRNLAALDDTLKQVQPTFNELLAKLPEAIGRKIEMAKTPEGRVKAIQEEITGAEAQLVKQRAAVAGVTEEDRRAALASERIGEVQRELRNVFAEQQTAFAKRTGFEEKPGSLYQIPKGAKEIDVALAASEQAIKDVSTLLEKVGFTADEIAKMDLQYLMGGEDIKRGIARPGQEAAYLGLPGPPRVSLQAPKMEEAAAGTEKFISVLRQIIAVVPGAPRVPGQPGAPGQKFPQDFVMPEGIKARYTDAMGFRESVQLQALNVVESQAYNARQQLDQLLNHTGLLTEVKNYQAELVEALRNIKFGAKR